MFGFAIATVVLGGLYLSRRHRRRGYGGGGQHQDCHSRYRHRRHTMGGFGRGRFGPMMFLARRLDLTPEQEKVVRDELEDLFEQARGLKRELRLFKDDVGQALRADSFDEEAKGMSDSFTRQDVQLEELRKSFLGAFATVHDVLDDRQRRRLADLLERGSMPGQW